MQFEIIKEEFGSSFSPHLLYGNIKNFNDESFLNEEELLIYGLIRNEKRKKEWVSSRVCAKKLISSVIKVSPQEITIGNDQNRKPYALIKTENRRFYISLSHRKEMVGAALNLDFNPYIGIDIEFIEDININFISDFMSEKELDCNLDKIIEIWSLKEAFFKMGGKGLSVNTRDIEFNGSNVTIKGKFLSVLTSFKICKIYYNTIRKDRYIVSLCWSGGTDGRK